MTAFGSNPEKNENSPAETAGQELFELELRIARRADELADTGVSRIDRNLEYWVRAEGEVVVECSAADSSNQEPFELELRIARRADELADTGMPRFDRKLEYWVQAEREVVAEWLGSRRYLQASDRSSSALIAAADQSLVNQDR
jgi:hypothetical protein